jgi:hypothetical protein
MTNKKIVNRIYSYIYIHGRTVTIMLWINKGYRSVVATYASEVGPTEDMEGLKET